jgi:hypothetical protein
VSRDITEELRSWSYATNVEPATEVMDQAADEIESLRSRLAGTAAALHDAVRLIGEYAHDSGFLLGSMEMINRNPSDAAAIAGRACRYLQDRRERRA